MEEKRMDKNKSNEGKKTKQINKTVLLQEITNTGKKNSYVYKNQKWISFYFQMIAQIQDHLNELMINKFIEMEEYNNSLNQLEPVFNSIKEIEDQFNQKKNNKTLFESNQHTLYQTLKLIVLQSGSKSVSNILNLLMEKNYYEDPINNLSEEYRDYIKIFDNYFVPFSVQIFDDLEQRTRFINTQNLETLEVPSIRNLLNLSFGKFKNFYEKIDGASIVLPLSDKIIVINGIFRKDSLGICRITNTFIKKRESLYEDIEYLDIPNEYKTKYIEQLSLRDFLLYSTRELALNIKNDYTEYQNLKSKSLSFIIKEFVKAQVDKQRKTLILLLLGDDESKFNANMIFDLMKNQNINYHSIPLHDLIYRSFHWKIQKIFKLSLKSFEDTKKKIENLSISDISYESRLASCKVSDYVKSKVMEKMREMNGSKENSNKAQQWLDGFFKIPFGTYREEPILKFFKSYKERLDTFVEHFSIELFEYENDVKNTIYEKHFDLLSQISNEYHDILNEKSENAYERFNKYLVELSNKLEDLDKVKIQKQDDFEFIDIENSPSSNQSYEIEIDVSNQEDDEERIIHEIGKTLSPENRIIFEKLIRKDGLNEETLEKCLEELDKFKEIKNKLMNSSEITPYHIDLLDSKLKDIENTLGINDLSNSKIVNNKPIDKNFRKFIMKNKRKMKTYVEEWTDFKIKKRKYIQQMENILDKCTYGQFNAKKQLKRLIAQWMNGNNEKGSCIGLRGPPGVGKTSLLKHGLSKCLLDDQGQARPLIFVPIGGSSNGSFLEGHNYTYLGSTWGKIVDALMEAKCLNPIIFIDELDKISKTEHGKEIASILTHITDETQNHEYFDRYFASIPIDLSRVLFVFSYNDKDNIDPILRDRIQEIEIKGLSKYEKIVICKNYILPEIYKNVGFGSDEIIFTNEILGNLIEDYTFEEGARRIKEILLNMVREINLEKVNGTIQDFPFLITEDFVKVFMEDKKKITRKVIHDRPMVGLCNGLFAVSGSSGIGGITPMQMMKFLPSEKKLSIEKITGSCGEDMVESVNYAFTLALNLIPENMLKKIMENPYSIHVHCGDSGKKSGPSAGAVLTVTFLSLLLTIPVRNNFCATGEITLTGRVTAIGGLQQKLNGAIKAGCTICCIPKENEEDLRLIIKTDQDEKAKMYRSESMKDFDLSPVKEHESFDYKLEENKVVYKDKLTVYIVDNIVDMLKIALVDNDIEWNTSFITKDI